MGKRKKTKDPPPKWKTSGDWHTRYVVLFTDMLDSSAYTALDAQARAVYQILVEQYKGNYTGDQVKCPYSTFEEHGIRRHVVSRALTQLECYGFIDIDSGGLGHRPNIYYFSDRWKEVSRSTENIQAAKNAFNDEMSRRKKAQEFRRTYRKGLP